MATLSSIPIPNGAGVTATLAATTATGIITLYKSAKVAINCSQISTIVFYNSATGVPPVPSATVGFQMPANVTFTFDLGNSMDSFNLFNTSASPASYSYQKLSTLS